MRDRSSGCRPSPAQAGFTLLELVVALVLFAFIVVEVLADRETSIKMSADARVIQTVRYLAAAKIDEIRHDPDRFGESDEDDFSYLNDEQNVQDFSHYRWELEMKRLVVVGASEDGEEDHLFEEDEEEEPAQTGEGGAVPPGYVRRLTLVVQFEPEGGEARPDLSVKIVTYIPDEEEEEEGL
ncbi:MAG: prepilin-type N-terminal cleavage/methylation domain-containing protein [Planctomycetota bacterium]